MARKLYLAAAVALLAIFTMFAASSEAGVRRFGHFSIDVPARWDVDADVDEDDDSVVVFTAPDESALLTIIVIENEDGVALQEMAELMREGYGGANLRRSGDIYTFQFVFEGFDSRAAVAGNRIFALMAVTGDWHNDLNGMLDSFQLAGISNQAKSEIIASLGGGRSGGGGAAGAARRARPGRPDRRPGAPAQSQPAPTQTGLSGYANEVVNLTNAERRRAGSRDLAVDNEAMAAAAQRARELERSFNHARPDGRDWRTVMNEYNVRQPNQYSGENILYNHSNNPAEAVAQWMDSQGHRENILRRDYTHIGVGVHQSGGRTYVVQVFIGR
ncbi:MAG: CAP domain-containing protein [Synergistaceae bacterium]|nr:CAP domain-containing protein [Synergistaceae bacterium]